MEASELDFKLLEQPQPQKAVVGRYEQEEEQLQEVEEDDDHRIIDHKLQDDLAMTNIEIPLNFE
jgi:hypothetical protein